VRTDTLRRLAQPRPPAADVERCDLCGEPLPVEHRHLLDIASGEPQCACRACAILFDRGQAGGDHYRLIPERRVCLPPLVDEDRLWAALGIPVDLAFLTRGAERVLARYPSPLGLTTAAPAADAWEQVVAANPALAGLEPDVEALLVHRARGRRERWIVPVDDCFRLAATLRSHWRGFHGGDGVWDAIDRFFAQLHARYDDKEAT
jgi:hypothetical protein